MTETESRSSTPRRFLASSLASYWSLGVRLIVGFGARVVLAHLLLPDAHGLYELALRIVTIASALRDLGLIFHLIRDDRRPYGTVLGFSLSSGVLVTLGILIGAPLGGWLDPRLPAVLRAFSLWVLLDGLAAVPRTYFERELRIGRLVAPEIARGLVMATVSIGLAWLGAGVWSFIVGDLVATGLFAALVWSRAWGKIPLSFEPALLGDLLRQSRGLFLIWVTFQLVTYIDVFIVEGVTGDTALVGQYSRAYMIAFLVRQIVFPRALVPALVEYRFDRERFRAAFRVTTVFLMSCEVIAGYFLFFNAEKVVEVMLGSEWSAAVPLLRILCFVPFLDVFSELGGEVLKVRHEDRLWLVIMVANLVSLTGVGVLLTSYHGAQGMALANFFLLGNVLMAWRMARIFRGAFLHLLGDMALIYAVPLPLLGGAALLLPAGSWARLVVSVAAALGAFALLAWRFWNPVRSFLADRASDAAAPEGA